MIKVKELDHKMVKLQKDSKDAAHKVGYRSLLDLLIGKVDQYISTGNQVLVKTCVNLSCILG